MTPVRPLRQQREVVSRFQLKFLWAAHDVFMYNILALGKSKNVHTEFDEPEGAAVHITAEQSTTSF